MFSYILTSKSSLDVLEKSFVSEHKNNISVIDNFDSFIISIISPKKVSYEDIFFEYEESSIGLIGNIFNRLELIILVQTIDPLSITYNDSGIFSVLFNAFGEKALSLIDGHFTVLFIKGNTIKFYTNSSPTYPLYYYNHSGEFWVSNEAKYISRLKNIDSSIIPLNNFDPKAYYPKYFTIFKSIKRLSLQSYLCCALNDSGIMETESGSYFDNKLQTFSIVDSEKILSALDHIFHTNTSGVLDNFCQDGNIAIALSGGVDSSLVAAYAKKSNPKINMHCFTTGTNDTNEFYYARLCSEYIGATHHKIIVDESMYVDGIMNIVYHNEVFDAFFVEVYATLNAVYNECKKYSNVLLTGVNADNIFSAGSKIFSDRIDTNVQQAFFDSSRTYWSGIMSPYAAKTHSITEYSPYTSHRLFSLMNSLDTSMKIRHNVDKYLLKILAVDKELLPSDNVWRKKIRLEQGGASDKIFADFLKVDQDSYMKRHLYIYKLFKLLFEEKVCFEEVDPYDLRNKLND